MATKKTLGFKTWRENYERVHSVPGDTVRILYSGKYDDDGRIVIEEVGKEDTYAIIQSYAESVDINNIMKRYQNGEEDVLSRVQGFYFDCSDLPDNMPELLNKFNDAERGFYSMPPEFREKYGNDFAQFICTFDPMDFVQIVNDEVEKPVEKEVENEQKQQ